MAEWQSAHWRQRLYGSLRLDSAPKAAPVGLLWLLLALPSLQVLMLARRRLQLPSLLVLTAPGLARSPMTAPCALAVGPAVLVLVAAAAAAVLLPHPLTRQEQLLRHRDHQPLQ